METNRNSKANFNNSESNVSASESFDKDTTRILSDTKKFILRNFKKELQEEADLEKKYKLSHTEEELSRRKELQESNKYLHIKRTKLGYNGLNKTWKWLRKHYLNTNVKNSIETWQYAKEMRNAFFRTIFECMIKSVGYTFLFYIWMRAVKQKGKKDFMYLFIVNTFISLNSINYNMYNFPINTKLPLNIEDLQNRKELIEELVFSGSKSYVLTEEIKKISKHYVKDKIEYSYVTSLGQKITFIVLEGRMYLLCDNYAEVFGFTGKNKMRKINNLDVMNMREKEIVIGLLKLYDALIDEYVKLYKIDKKKEKNFNTKIFEDIINKKKLDFDTIDLIRKTKLLKNVEYDKVNTIEIKESNLKNLTHALDINEKVDDYESVNEKKKNCAKETKFYI